MFIPDEAFIDGYKLKPSTFRVYGGMCKFRNHRKRVSRAKPETLAKVLNLALGTVRNAITELTKAGWIEDSPLGGWVLLKGDFSPVNKPQDKRLSSNGESSSDSEKRSPNSEAVSSNSEEFSPIDEEVSPDSEEFSPNGEERIYKVHARGSYQTSDQTLHQTEDHTHTPDPHASRHGPPESPAASPRVCVSPISFSKFSKAEIRDYAKANIDARGQPLGEGWIKTAWKSGDYDDVIEIFIQNGGKVERSNNKSKWEQAVERIHERREQAANETQHNGLAAGAG